MSEFEGPFYYKCPRDILDMLSPTTDQYALAWRERVLQVLNKVVPKINAGDIVEFNVPVNFTNGFTFDRMEAFKCGKSLRFRGVGSSNPTGYLLPKAYRADRIKNIVSKGE